MKKSKRFVGVADKWDSRFMQIAENEISKWSKDPDTKVGCLLVSKDRRQFSLGYNGFPRGILDSKVRLNNRDEKRTLSAHAELNAILNARRDLSGWTLYVTKAPCEKCAIAIIQAGIVRVVCPPFDPKEKWGASQALAKSLLGEAGIVYSVF